MSDYHKKCIEQGKQIASLELQLEAIKREVEDMGERHNECTRNITGNVCFACECGKQGEGKG